MDRYPAAFAKSAQFEETMASPSAPTPALFSARTCSRDRQEPPRTWDDAVAIADAIGPRGSTSSRSRSTSTTTVTARTSLSGSTSCGRRGRTCSTRTPAPSGRGGGSRGHRGLHRPAHGRKATNASSISFVEQDARQSFQQGKSAMIPVWWWAYSPFINPKASVRRRSRSGSWACRPIGGVPSPTRSPCPSRSRNTRRIKGRRGSS